MLPSIVNQLGPEGFASLRKLAMEKVPAAKDDDVPELEGDFEEASKQEEEQSKAVSSKKTNTNVNTYNYISGCRVRNCELDKGTSF